jgi:hypothetical protein
MPVFLKSLYRHSSRLLLAAFPPCPRTSKIVPMNSFEDTNLADLIYLMAHLLEPTEFSFRFWAFFPYLCLSVVLSILLIDTFVFTPPTAPYPRSVVVLPKIWLLVSTIGLLAGITVHGGSFLFGYVILVHLPVLIGLVILIRSWFKWPAQRHEKSD